MMATTCHHPFQTIKTTTRDARDDNNTEQRRRSIFFSLTFRFQFDTNVEDDDEGETVALETTSVTARITQKWVRSW
jgi:hypothetical protein